jgi:FxsC-like protein
VAWRPFPDQQELPLAEYAVRVAERLDFSVQVIGISKADDQIGSGPGLLLIDPWYLTDGNDLQKLRDLVSSLPEWFMPVVVYGSAPEARATHLTPLITDILGASKVKRTEPVRRALQGIYSLEGFASILPVLVTEAERQYLRYGLFERPPVPPGTRLRLSGHGALPPQRPEEDSDE